MKNKLKCCGFCQHHVYEDEDDFVCTCEESEYFQLYTKYTEICDCFEPWSSGRGEWIVGKKLDGTEGHECSRCHDYAPYYSTGEEYLSFFCPHCGADMHEEG